jgi:hypothetical protein
MSNQTACSHINIKHTYTDHPGGGRSVELECPDCGTRFYPEHFDMNRARLRATIATAIMAALTANPEILERNSDWDDKTKYSVRAFDSVRMADALMCQLDKPKKAE